MDAVDKKRLRQDKKNYARRQHRQEARQALFIKDYVKEKYHDVYEEASAFYNYVNNMYPTKPDIRRTEEFKALRLGFTFVAKNKNKVLTKPLQVYKSITDLSEQNFIIHCYPTTKTQQPTTETQQPTTETQQSTTETQQPTTETQQSTTKTQQPTTETQQSTTETQQPTTETQTKKTMQLRIPLLSPSLITQTQNIITQEIVEENPLTVVCNQTIPEDIHPIFDDEIPQETYEAILRELRQDPDLSKIMDDLDMTDNDLDMMDVDLPPEDDRLEQELLEQELYNLW